MSWWRNLFGPKKVAPVIVERDRWHHANGVYFYHDGAGRVIYLVQREGPLWYGYTRSVSDRPFAEQWDGKPCVNGYVDALSAMQAVESHSVGAL